ILSTNLEFNLLRRGRRSYQFVETRVVDKLHGARVVPHKPLAIGPVLFINDDLPVHSGWVLAVGNDQRLAVSIRNKKLVDGRHSRSLERLRAILSNELLELLLVGRQATGRSLHHVVRGNDGADATTFR